MANIGASLVKGETSIPATSRCIMCVMEASAHTEGAAVAGNDEKRLSGRYVSETDLP